MLDLITLLAAPAAALMLAQPFGMHFRAAPAGDRQMRPCTSSAAPANRL